LLRRVIQAELDKSRLGGVVEKMLNERGRSKQRPYKGLFMRFS
jgi:hypothetical protein